MNLWIRTQRKNRLCLAHNFVVREANKNGYYAVAENRNKNTIEYGIYSTKERALEVLDKIQDILKPTIYYECNESPIYDSHKEYGNDGNIYETKIYTTSSIKMEPKLKSIEVNDYVYQMPKE